MATNKRTYPNDYFAWYNDDKRLAIVALDTTSTSGERTKEKYDTFQGSGNLSGTITDADCSGTTITFTSASHGLNTDDRISVSGTTNFNDDNLSSQSITKLTDDTFTMTRSSSDTNTNETGTWTSLFVDKGLRLTYHSFYNAPSGIENDLEETLGLNSGLHSTLICYLKARLYEDQGDLEKAMYYRKMYEKNVAQYPSRKSGVRSLAVPYI
jgi:hypothetical protein